MYIIYLSIDVYYISTDKHKYQHSVYGSTILNIFTNGTPYAGMAVDNITVADVAYPLVTTRVASVFQQQLIHVRNGCISDDPHHLPYAKVGTVNLHMTGHHLSHYQSLRGTSKVEAVHSVLDRTFYSQRGIGAEVFDARLGWWIIGYNRRRMRAHGKLVPPDSMTPKVCMCTRFSFVIVL